MKLRLSWSIFAIVGLYALALNPWFMPDQHDDVLYFYGATSIVDEGTYSLFGAAITDWPPGLSFLFSLLFRITGPCVIVAKCAILAFVALGLYLLPRFLRGQGRSYPVVCTALAALFPASFLMGTRVLSEWPFLTVTALFFLALDRLRKTPSWRWALVVGVMLAVASLTRFIGVFLGAAIVWQWWLVYRSDGGGISKVWKPELFAAGLGGALWLGWRWRCARLVEQGLADVGNYDQAGYFKERFTNFDPLHFFVCIEEMMLSVGRVAGKMGLPEFMGQGVALVLGGVLIYGLIVHLRKRGLQPVDAYVLVCLFVLLLDLKKPVRYFMPLAPFIASYLIEGVVPLGQRWLKERAKIVLRMLTAGWMCWLILLNGILLIKGNASGTHHGLSMLVSRTPEAFYQGDWSDLYELCLELQASFPGETIGVHGEVISKYVSVFAELPVIDMPQDVDLPHRVLLTDESVERLPMYEQGWAEWKSLGKYRVLRKLDDQ